MNLRDEISKMQQQTISIRLQATDHASMMLRDMARQSRLAKALENSHAQHWIRVKYSGLDPRMN